MVSLYGSVVWPLVAFALYGFLALMAGGMGQEEDERGGGTLTSVNAFGLAHSLLFDPLFAFWAKLPTPLLGAFLLQQH